MKEKYIYFPVTIVTGVKMSLRDQILIKLNELSNTLFELCERDSESIVDRAIKSYLCNNAIKAFIDLDCYMKGVVGAFKVSVHAINKDDGIWYYRNSIRVNGSINEVEYNIDPRKTSIDEIYRKFFTDKRVKSQIINMFKIHIDELISSYGNEQIKKIRDDLINELEKWINE